MVSIRGFDHFCDFLEGLEDFYCIIGGGAAAILLETDDLEFRATKDVDLLVLAMSDDLNDRILQYVKTGGYETREATEKEPKYYRFTHPTDNNCPKVIEIFARNQLKLELNGDQRVIPISHGDGRRLSALLLDQEYFELIQKNIIKSREGIPLINALANICLKAAAYRDLLERRQSGDSDIDQNDISKHLKDIWRLAVVLKGDESITISGKPQKDIDSAVRELNGLPEAQFRQVMSKYPGVDKGTLMSVLTKIFRIQ
jgi:hypothetical protein